MNRGKKDQHVIVVKWNGMMWLKCTIMNNSYWKNHILKPGLDLMKNIFSVRLCTIPKYLNNTNLISVFLFQIQITPYSIVTSKYCLLFWKWTAGFTKNHWRHDTQWSLKVTSSCKWISFSIPKRDILMILQFFDCYVF